MLFAPQVGGATVKGDEPDAPPKIVRQCSLDKPTQELIKMIFDNDMFNNAMQKLELGELVMTMLCVLLHVEYYPLATIVMLL